MISSPPWMLVFNLLYKLKMNKSSRRLKLMEEIKLKGKKKEGIFLSDEEDSRFADSIWCFSPYRFLSDQCQNKDSSWRASSYVNSPWNTANCLLCTCVRNGDTSLQNVLREAVEFWGRIQNFKFNRKVREKERNKLRMYTYWATLSILQTSSVHLRLSLR